MVCSFLAMKTLIQIPIGLTKIIFNDFLISNKNVGFIMDLVNSIIIFDLRSSFATFELLKSVKFLIHAVVQNLDSKHFHSNALSIQNYIVVTVTWFLHWSCILWKMVSLKIIVFWKLYHERNNIHFSHHYKLVKTGNFFWIYKAIEK